MFNKINLNPNLIDNNSILKNSSIYYKNTKDPNNIETNFLKILVEQIKNQDPINPITNSEFTSQLAQIKTASNVQKIENIIESILSRIDIEKILNKPYFNSEIKIPSSKFTYNNENNNKKVPLGIVLYKNSQIVDVMIKNQSGKVILLKNIGPLNAGIHKLQWDGKNLLGQTIPKGEYQFSVVAKEGNELSQAEPLTFLNVRNINSNDNKKLSLINI